MALHKDHKLKYVREIAKTITCVLFGTEFTKRIERDRKDTENGRIFIQLTYRAPDNSNIHIKKTWKGRKWYLSDHMTEDEIVKTLYAAFEAVVKHEIMEGFKVNEVVLFNPHVHYKELLNISNKEVFR